MVDTRTAPVALLILRVVLGLLFLAHVWLKIFVFTPAGTAGFFASLGLPGWFAYVTMLWEILGGLALILGVWPRAAALAMVPLLLGTIVTVHGPAGFFFDSQYGGWGGLPQPIWRLGISGLLDCRADRAGPVG
ncbi:Putative oxidoreductase catD [Ketogulonicigenium vulgare Y25]|uniref:DoxX family protein n=1 Tax=Ketogulonicigenium vulgare TaxID=92945 RepID=UPI0001E6804B|nr:Putative oxidoreductase catD [Ketogulonicigenium vulgare Y25]